MIYRNDDPVIIRSLEKSDIKKFVESFAAQNWHKSNELFEGYYKQQKTNEVKVIVAQVRDEVAGYVTLFPNATVGPYTNKNIPEIVDLNVLIKFQKKGIGNRMLEVAERLAKEKSDSVSLAVGLHYGYGAAQRMYVKRGYIPDGSGVWYKGEQLEQYTECVNDDDLLLYFLKTFLAH